MSNVFANMGTEGLEESQDRIGGFSARPSGLLTGKIKVAYAGKSAGGAHSVTVILDCPDGQEYRETYYVTNKAGQNYYLNKQDQTKKMPLPGFSIVNDICLVTSGAPVSEQTMEDKMVNIWDKDASKELPKSVPVLVDLIGKEVTLGVLNQLVNKSDKVGNDYVANADTREENVTDKVFHTETRMTTQEARSGASAGVFIDAWDEKNKGVQRDKRTVKDGQAGSTGAPKASGNATAAAPKKSLFSK